MNDKSNMTPLSVIMDMAKEEILIFISQVSTNNNIPPGIMIYILKDVLSNLQDQNIAFLNGEIVNCKEQMHKNSEEKHETVSKI